MFYEREGLLSLVKDHKSSPWLQQCANAKLTVNCVYKEQDGGQDDSYYGDGQIHFKLNIHYQVILFNYFPSFVLIDGLDT